jgi:uncharacterized protein (DUF58 family)
MSVYQSAQASFSFEHLSRRLHRFPFLPTSYGLLLIMVLVAIVIGALNYENNLGLILAFLLTGILLTSLFQANRCLAALKLQPGNKSTLFANTAGSFEVIILPRENLSFSMKISVPGEQPVTVPVVSPGRPARVRLPLRPEKRGWLYLDLLEVTTAFPFGLWLLRRRKRVSVRLLVYPQPLPARFRTTTSQTGDEGDRVSGSGVDDFLGLRPYVPGDLIQRLAWKASSRGQGFFSKDFGALAGTTLHFDWQAAGPGDVETRLSRLCHLILNAKARRLPYSLSIPGQSIPAGSGETHLYRCLNVLALFQHGE